MCWHHEGNSNEVYKGKMRWYFLILTLILSPFLKLSLILRLSLVFSPSPTISWLCSQQQAVVGQDGKALRRECAHIGAWARAGEHNLIFGLYFTYPKSDSHDSRTIGFMKMRVTLYTQHRIVWYVDTSMGDSRQMKDDHCQRENRHLDSNPLVGD